MTRFLIFQKKRIATISIISLDDELKNFPSESRIVWRANNEDLNIVNKSFRYIARDTLKYKELVQVIPRFIPKPEILLFKFQCCFFQATDMESLIKHLMTCRFALSTLQCEFCPNTYNFSSAPALRDHYEKHSSNEIFICVRCNTFSSCKKWITDHVSSSHVMEDVLILEISRSECCVDPVSNYSIFLKHNRKVISTFSKCIFCDLDLFEMPLEEHLINHHFFKLYYSCWKCEQVNCRNPYDLDKHFETVHFGVSKLNIKIKLRFDTIDDEFFVKKEIPMINEEPFVVQPAIVATQSAMLSEIEIKQETLDIHDIIDDFINIEDDESMNHLLDLRLLNGSN